jgi:hypothetical protein
MTTLRWFPRWFLVDTTHPAYPIAQNIARAQHEQFGRSLLSVTLNQPGDRALIKILEDSPEWRNGTPFETLPDLVITILNKAAHDAFTLNEWLTPEWQDNVHP